MQVTQLSREMKRTEGQCQYDENVKVLLSNKQVLAMILKYAVKEFMPYDLEIVINCIEEEPEVSKRGVYPGSRGTEKIVSMNSESKIPNEGMITYDIRFYAIVPDGNSVKIILNIEAQKKYHVGYSLEARGVFYCARMLSEQLDVEFTTDNYNEIKKVYSIWICMNSPKKYANTISEYSMQKKDLYGKFKGEEYYDLLSVVLIRLSKKQDMEMKQNKLIKFLSVLLSHEMNTKEKRVVLEQEYDMIFEKDIEGGMSSMCNLSDLIVEEVTCQKIVETVEKIMRNLNISLEKACTALEITVEQYENAKIVLENK